MPIIKSVHDIARLSNALRAARFTGGRFISVEFESDPHFIKQIMPPGLDAGESANIRAVICEFTGGSCGAFTGASISVPAQHGPYAGNYTLFMYVNSDDALLFGRDLYGEPKKMCDANFAASDNRVSGWIDRRGKRLIAIEATLGDEQDVYDADDFDFNYKCALSINGVGLAADPVLTLSKLRTRTKRLTLAHASLLLDGNIHDPLHEIPVGTVSQAFYLEANVEVTAEALATVPADEFLPFAYGRLPHWGAFSEA